MKKVIIIGIGNPLLSDDKIGHAFIDYLVSKWDVDTNCVSSINLINLINSINIDNANYDIYLTKEFQLDIVHISLLKEHDLIIIVDASKQQESSILVKEIEPHDFTPTFSSHVNSLEYILFLLNKMYNHYPKFFLLGIMGNKWDIDISTNVENNYDFSDAYKSLLLLLADF